MKCPRCREDLEASRKTAGDLKVDSLRCFNCTGNWLELDALHALEQVVDVRFIEWNRLPGVETQGRILFCPRCRGGLPMDKVLSKRDSRVVMDVCATCHGVWLDYGELEAIQQKSLFAALADVVSFIRHT